MATQAASSLSPTQVQALQARVQALQAKNTELEAQSEQLVAKNEELGTSLTSAKEQIAHYEQWLEDNFLPIAHVAVMKSFSMVATSKSLREPTGLWRNACASVHIYETSLAEFKETGCLEGNEQLHLEWLARQPFGRDLISSRNKCAHPEYERMDRLACRLVDLTKYMTFKRKVKKLAWSTFDMARVLGRVYGKKGNST